MAKKVRNLIIGGVVLLALVISVVILWVTDPGDTADSSEETDTVAYTFVDKDQSQVALVRVSNTKGEFEVRQVEDTSWECEELSGLPLADNAYTALTAAAATVQAQQEITNYVTDLNEYGLAEPASTVYAEYGDGDTLTLLLGNMTPDGSGYYCKENGRDNIYIINSINVASFFASKYSFIETKLLPDAPSSSSDAASGASSESTEEAGGEEIQRIEMIRKTDSAPIVIQKNTETTSVSASVPEYLLSSPVKGSCNADTAAAYVTGAYGITADEAIAIFPSAEEKEKYGLQSPQGTFHFTIGEKTYTIFVGNSYTHSAEEYVDEDASDPEDEESYYVMLEGTEVIYNIHKDFFQWQTVDAISLYATTQLSPAINNVKEIQAEVNGKTYNMQLAREENNEGETTVTGVSINGTAIDLEKFQTYFTLLKSAPAEEINTASSQAGAAVKITYKYWDSSFSDDTLSFIPEGDRKYILSINGEQSFLCRSAYVSRLISETEKIAKNQPVIAQW